MAKMITVKKIYKGGRGRFYNYNVSNRDGWDI